MRTLLAINSCLFDTFITIIKHKSRLGAKAASFIECIFVNEAIRFDDARQLLHLPPMVLTLARLDRIRKYAHSRQFLTLTSPRLVACFFCTTLALHEAFFLRLFSRYF